MVAMLNYCREARGVAMIASLLILIAVLLVGASAARLALQNERAARAERDRQMAFQAAEDGLLDAERDIDAGAPGGDGASGGDGGAGGGIGTGTGTGTGGTSTARAAMFAPDSALGFVDGCGIGNDGANLGLCRHAAVGAASAWQTVDLSNDETHTAGYGQFTGAIMQTGQGFLPFKRPRYIIERMVCHRAGEDAGTPPAYCYRVTAIGFGAQPATQVVLQSVYRKPD